MTIAKRPLGSQGLKVSAQGLGCMGMSSFYNDREHSASEEENVNVVHRALDLGVDFLDSSDAYGPHANEELLGRATKGQPYVVATKFGLVVSEAGISTNNKPEYVRSACEGSLKRLGVKSIDLWYIHRIDPSVDIADTIRAMKELVEEGKVRYIGLSEANASDIRKAHAVHPITAVQLEWSLYTRDAEEEVIPTCRELGIGIVAYAPIGRGMLSGNLKDISQLNDDDFRRTIPRFADDEAFKQNLKQVAKIAELAQDKGCTSAQLALAWVHHQGCLSNSRHQADEVLGGECGCIQHKADI